jgi:hypothetical protein
MVRFSKGSTYIKDVGDVCDTQPDVGGVGLGRQRGTIQVGTLR